MFFTAVRNLWAHKIRLFTTALAVMLGVSFLAGTMVLTDTISRTFNNLFSDVYNGTDAVVRGVAAFQGPQNTGAQRPRVDASLVAKLRNVPGVAADDGQYFGYARLADKNGKAMGNPANGAPTIGASYEPTQRLRSFTLVSGAWPVADNEVVIDKGSAKKGHLAVGDTTIVIVQGGPQTVRISGIARFGRADSPGGATIVVFTQNAAARLIGEPGKFDSIAFAATPGVSQEQLVRNLQAQLPPGVEAVTGKQVAKEADNQIHSGLAFFNTFLLIFAVVALFAGGFMIFNTFSITVAQRTRENGLLRALGATRKQVLASVLLEALAVGLVASVLGLVLGVVVAAGLKGLLAAVGFDIPAGGLALARHTVIAALLVGVGVTVAGAFVPARKAGRVPPVAAMQDAVSGSSGYGSKQRVLVGIGLLGGGAALLFTGLFGGVSNAVAIVGLGAVTVLFGVSVLGRTVALPLSRFIGSPLPRLRGMTGALARENAMRNPKRTAATASALMVCIAVVGLMNIMASSTRASINSIVSKAFTGDFVADPGGGVVGGVDHSLVVNVSQRPEVKAATAIRITMAKVNGTPQMLVGADPATAPALVNVRPVQGSMQDLGMNEIAVYSKTAADKGLKLGSQVPVVFKDSGTRTLRVALIYGENQPMGNYFVGMAAFEANVSSRLDYGVYIKKAPGVPTAAALAAVKTVTKDYPGVTVMDQAAFKASIAKPFNQLLGLVYALLLLAIIIAILGIANTLALSIFERTRELGILRAVGMTRSQLRSTIRWESVIISVQGTVLGLAVGVFFGWALVRAMARTTGTTVFSIPFGILIAVVIFGAIVGVVAAVLPGRRAAKLDILRAVVSE